LIELLNVRENYYYNIITITRMLVINVSIPNVTVARVEQFQPPQLRIQRERPTDVWVDRRLAFV